MTILVTGGAGYIGSHVVRQLGERNEKLIVLDNLSTGYPKAVLHGELVIGDTNNAELVTRLLNDHPLKYYGNNTCATRNLLQCCRDAKVKRFIFSSTAAVYGLPASGTASEDSPTAPINPYGTSKLMTEMMLRDLCGVTPMKHVILRYFNVGGSNPDGKVGHSAPTATLLTKVACQHALGIRPFIKVFGTDYDTPDGTGVRDYIHVEDLASAHLDALNYLRNNGESITLNVGYGRGFSVREVLSTVAKVSGQTLKIVEEPRRAGDPASLVAKADRVRSILGWQPKFDNLDVIARTQLAWEKHLLKHPELLQK